jgi:hypothetical protein
VKKEEIEAFFNTIAQFSKPVQRSQRLLPVNIDR